MRKLRDEIDLHVIALLLLISPIVFLGWGWLLVPLLLPQGCILVRAFSDKPTFGVSPWTYLAVNELVVVVAIAALAAFKLTVRSELGT